MRVTRDTERDLQRKKKRARYDGERERKREEPVNDLRERIKRDRRKRVKVKRDSE
jgi:hypothetical protein